jgi:cutinase
MARQTSIQKKALIGAAALVSGFALLTMPAPEAASAPCPDVDVVFARGSGEPPGLGQVGGPFVDALTPELGARSLTVYSVNYEASTDFSSPDFPKSVVNGIRDAGAHVQSMAANCPKTKEVLSGYSQGAAVAGFVTAAGIPPGVPADQVPKPLAPEIANHVAAVVLFGTPSDQFLTQYGAPPITIGPLYQAKTIELCAPGDGICGDGDSPIAHVSYPVNGMVAQGADFAASHL